jgi:hypothetical protein
MKNKYLFIVLMLGLAGMLTMQSCTKDESPTPVIYKAAVPANPTPAEGDVVDLDGTSYTLKWEGTTTTSWDVYFGPAGDVQLVKAGVTANTYTVTGITEGGEYEWYVWTKDANGITSSNITGPTRDPWYFYINTAPTAPVLTAPADGAVGFSVAGALTWTSDDAEGDDLTYDVFVGTSATPALVATGLTAATYSPKMVASTMYYWQVIAKDSHGYTASSAVHSFTTGLEPIMTFTGNYNVDEPAEGWNYDVTFVKGYSTTIKIGTGTGAYDGWWASWPATFTLDFTAKTYSMPYTVFTSGYAGVEAGGIDLATGTLQGTYTVWHNGAIIEQGVHTYVKK